MHRFYVTPKRIIGDNITITGPDVNHIKNVLRMNLGDGIIICNGQGKDCYCIIEKMSDMEINTVIQSITDTGTELKSRIILFQGLPKKDKMELVVQKAVELGVYEIVPVISKRCIVKYEDKKKEAKKIKRWQLISESASKQSKRGLIPVISSVLTFNEAVKRAGDMQLALIPYENAEGIEYTKQIISRIGEHKDIGIIIGPEGGFDDNEIAYACANNVIPITLGRRILRTETAGIAILSMIMLSLEE